MKKASVIILKIISTAAALFASYYALIIKSMSAKKECVFLFEKLRLLYNMKHIRKRTSLYLCFLQTILSGAANCCFHIFTLYIKISFCPHTFCQKYRMNFKKI